jgi:outer membrane protein OmpA-like peptidoglycan-associated protein
LPPSFDLNAELTEIAMLPRHRLISFSSAGGVVFSCLLIGGCASEQALQAQTQPLQEQIARVEQTLAAAENAGLRAAQASTDSLAARQTVLEKQLANVQAGIESLHDKFKALEARGAPAESRRDAVEAALAGRIDGIEKSLNETAELANKTARQAANMQVRQDADAATNAALAARVGDAERHLAEATSAAARSAGEMAQQTDLLKSRQDADAVANRALDARLNLAEQKLNTLSGLVQEALALAAKEIFLANGKEAFTVLLTDDKVLYPQNDPNLDPRDTAKLDELAEKLVKLDQEYHLDIQGHTANNSTDDNNYNLGKARAEVVKRYLHEQKGISINRMSTISYGANKPLNPSNGNNRRIFIRVLVLK